MKQRVLAARREQVRLVSGGTSDGSRANLVPRWPGVRAGVAYFVAAAFGAACAGCSVGDDGGAAAARAPAVEESDSAAALALLLNPADPRWTERAPDLFRARFETSRGPFVIEVHRDWAPLGADRFHNLVRHGFYDGERFTRVLAGYIVQWGLHGDPRVSAAWKDVTISDDPVVQGNTRGTIGFAMRRPDDRSTQVYINLDDNSRNDAQGFATFGRVIEGMEVVDSLYSGYGEEAGGGMRAGRQGPVEEGGNAYLAERYPLLDYIISARIERVPSM